MSSVHVSRANLPDVPIDAETRALKRAIADARRFRYVPSATVLCRGEPLFRSQLSRDLACLLDIDPRVVAWRCLPCAMRFTDDSGTAKLHVPDFEVHRADGSIVLMDAVGPNPPESFPDRTAIEGAISDIWVSYQVVPEASIRVEPKLSNAKELLRYAGTRVPLGDRVRFLAELEESGPLPIAECLHAFRASGDPVGVIATLALSRFISIDLDEAPIGPETLIRRRRD